jgi:polar amino acid transport system permease protein
MERFADSFFNVAVWARYWHVLLDGFWLTVLLAGCVLLAGIATGIVLAALRASQSLPLVVPIVVFADIFRALPPLVILVVAYFALPFAGLTVSGFFAAWLGLSLVLAAFVEEIVHGGIEAVELGQWDAARALGLSPILTLCLVILPQVLRTTLAPITSRAIAVAKNTALASVIAVPELLSNATSAQAASANTTPLTIAALLYVVMFLPLVLLSRWIESRGPWRG